MSSVKLQILLTRKIASSESNRKCTSRTTKCQSITHVKVLLIVSQTNQSIAYYMSRESLWNPERVSSKNSHSIYHIPMREKELFYTAFTPKDCFSSQTCSKWLNLEFSQTPNPSLTSPYFLFFFFMLPVPILRSNNIFSQNLLRIQMGSPNLKAPKTTKSIRKYSWKQQVI